MPNFVYDRTNADVINKTAKGYINYSDLLRIKTAIDELARLLKAENYFRGTISNNLPYSPCPPVSTGNIDSALYLVVTQDVMTLIFFTDVVALYSCFYTSAVVGRQVTNYRTFDKDTGKVSILPSTLRFATYNTFNNLEKVIYDMYMLITDIIDHYRECDTFWCGED